MVKKMAKNIWDSLWRSFFYAFKEWRLLLSMIFIGSLNIYFLYQTIYSLGIPIKIIYSFTQFILLVAYISLLGKLARKINNLEELSFLEIIRRGSISGVIFILFALIWYVLIRSITIITSNFWIIYVLDIIVSSLLATSIILECINVFFLEKEIFSLYSVLTRLFNWRYLIGYGVVIAFIMIIYPITSYLCAFLSKLNVVMTLNAFLSSIIYGIVIGYISLVTLYFFLQILNDIE